MSVPSRSPSSTVDLAVLREVPYFAELPESALRALLAQSETRRVGSGDLILMEGEPCGGLCMVASGRVRVYKSSPEGREQVLRILGPGRTANDVAVFDGGPNPGSVAAEDPSVVLLMPRPAVLDVVEKYPRAAQAAIAILASRLRAITGLVEDLALRGVVQRVARLLLQCSQGANPLVEGVEEVCGHLTQDDLASMTGSVRDVVQRALKVLERDGVIRVERAHIRIVQPGRLEQWGVGEPS